MKIINPSIIVETFNSKSLLKRIEAAGRTCYKSEKNITNKSAGEFVKKIIKNGHESVLEHEKITVRIICDRGISHEIVRHRLASYSQESTRYVNYCKKEMEFIRPCFWKNIDIGGIRYTQWVNTMKFCEDTYRRLIDNGASPQEARSVLPNSLKTEIVVTMNLRAWRHFLKLRCASASHPQMREIALMILKDLNTKLPEIFGDLAVSFNTKTEK